MSIQVLRVRHAWPVQENFTINRPNGTDDYTLLYFHSPMQLRKNDEIITTAPGSFIVYSPHTPQWFHSDAPMKHDWMHLTGDVEDALAAAGLQTNRIYLPENGEFITELTRLVELEHFSQPAGYLLMNELRVRQLLLQLFRACNRTVNQEKPKPAMERQLQQVRSKVFSQPELPWTVEKMAQLCYLSTSRFHTVYRSVFGLSPTDDLIRVRIEKAKGLLISGNGSVKDIAEYLGYKNVTHFCRQFKTLTGATPTRYRQINTPPGV